MDAEGGLEIKRGNFDADFAGFADSRWIYTE